MRIQLLKSIVLVVITVFSYNSQAQTTYLVTNINDSGAGSLRAAADSVVTHAVNNDIIRFSTSLLTTSTDSISLSSEINFGEIGVIIKGLYTPTDTLYISGGNISRIFYFNGGGKVVLDSLVLINGNGAGALYTGSGGAICHSLAGDTININNSIFIGNIASNSGGGIYSASPVSINHSKFIDNKASVNGGAIYSYGLTNSIVNVDNSTFSGNIAVSDGGGIYSFANGSNPVYSASVNIDNSTFSDNIANIGGGIYSNGVTNSFVNVDSSIFTGNIASSYGGAVYSYALNTYSSFSSFSIVSVDYSTFSGNTASKGGGLASVSYQLSFSTVNVDHSTFSENTASANGGALYSSSTSMTSTVNVNHSTFNGNSAVSNGGAVYSDCYAYSTVGIKNSTFSGNTANNGGGVSSNSPSFAPSSLKVGSSIFDNSSIFNQSLNNVISNGFNAFSDMPTGTSGTGDFVNQTLNLQPLAFNNGKTETMLPLVGSNLIDNGNPADPSDAQNRPIVGARDIGAAEYNCITPNQAITKSTCDTYTWIDGIIYNSDTTGVVFTKLSNVTTICDSLFTLDLTINNSTTVDTSVIAYGNFTWFGMLYDSVGIFTDTNNLMNVLGCDSTIILHLTVMPDTSITQNGLVLTANQNGANYQWLNCSNGCSVIAGETNQSYALTNNGSYAVQISLNGLTDTSSTIVFNSLGINNFTQSSYKLYPNPVKNELTIESQGGINQIEVYNITGQLLQIITPTSKLVKIDLAIYERGVYLVKLHTDKGIVSTSRVVKE